MIGSPFNDDVDVDTSQLSRYLEVLDKLNLQTASATSLRAACVEVGIEQPIIHRCNKLKQRRYYVLKIKKQIETWAQQVDTWIYCDRCLKWKIVAWGVARDLKVNTSLTYVPTQTVFNMYIAIIL